jgi:hypothetical protein
MFDPSFTAEPHDYGHSFIPANVQLCAHGDSVCGHDKIGAATIMHRG